jgi:hypothetical protein
VQVEYASDLDADVYGSGFAVLPAGGAGQSPAGGGEGGSPGGGGGTAGGGGEGSPGGGGGTSEEEEGVPHTWDFGELVDHPSNLLRVIGANIPAGQFK